MTSQEIEPGALRDRLEAADVDLRRGEATGYISLGNKINLNAIAIGLGLENIEYEPERFPGLIYHVEEPQATVVLFGSGVLTTVDAANDQAVTDAILATVERISDLGLLGGDFTSAENADTSPVDVDIQTIPVTDEL